MEIREYVRILRSNWWIIALVTVIGLGAGYAYNMTRPTTYQACSQLFVTTEGGTTVGETYQNNLFSQERVVSYAGLATSNQVAERAIQQLGIDMSASDLRSQITATPVAATVLLDLCVTDGDAATAQQLTNAVSAQLTRLVQELETSQGGGTAAATATVVDQADLPSNPVSPVLSSNLILGGASGFFLGLLLALAWGLRDRSVRSRERVEEATGGNILGGLPRDKTRKMTGVADLSGPIGEPLRSLRTNLRFLGGGRAPHVLAITSANAGEGRTSVAMDLAAVLAEAGHSVVLVGGDMRNPMLGKKLGLSENRGLSTVLSGEYRLDEAVQPNVLDGVAVLPSGPIPPNPSELLGTDQAQDMLDALRGSYRYVIIDTPPLNEVSDGAILSAMSDGAIVLARLGKTTRPQLQKALKGLDNVGARVLGAVVTFEAPVKGRKSNHVSSNTTSKRGVLAASDANHR